MFKQKYRKICKNDLLAKGYCDPQLFFDRYINGKGYTSYWGDGLRRMEVIYAQEREAVLIYELKFIDK